MTFVRMTFAPIRFLNIFYLPYDLTKTLILSSVIIIKFGPFILFGTYTINLIDIICAFYGQGKVSCRAKVAARQPAPVQIRANPSDWKFRLNILATICDGGSFIPEDTKKTFWLSCLTCSDSDHLLEIKIQLELMSKRRFNLDLDLVLAPRTSLAGLHSTEEAYLLITQQPRVRFPG